jgi:DNA-binding NarL/FixJ family response regulator
VGSDFELGPECAERSDASRPRGSRWSPSLNGLTSPRAPARNVTVRAFRTGGCLLEKMSPTMRAGNPLFGRATELETLTELLDNVAVEGSALALRGGAGVGKSTLLETASRLALERGFVVLRGTGAQSETQMPFAGLHQMLRPLLAEPIDLPAIQRDALLAAFGASPDVPDVFLVALAALNLVSERAAEAPILLLIDDVHWVDGPTRDVLAFIARRLSSDPIVLLAASRSDGESALDRAELRELRISPLDPTAASALLDAQAPGLNGAVRGRLLAEAAGNPLGLIELPAAWRERQLGEGSLLSWLPLTERLERAFAARIGDLPPTTRSLLLVAAVNDADSLAEALQATFVLIDVQPTIQHLTPAERFIEVDGQALRFRHPLMRSAIRQAAPTADRRAAHAALASVLVDQPDRRVWHRAESAIGPDDDVAGELEAAAARIQRRRGTSLAVLALKRAAELSETPPQREARLLAAAQLAHEGGLHNIIPGLLNTIEPAQLSTLNRKRLQWLTEFLAWETGVRTPEQMVALAEELLAEGEVQTAVEALVTAGTKSYWFGSDRRTSERIRQVADRLSDHPEYEPTALFAFAQVASEDGEALVIERLAAIPTDSSIDANQLAYGGMALNHASEWTMADSFLTAALDRLRRQGRLALMPRALVAASVAASTLGHLARAAASAAEAAALAQEAGPLRTIGPAELQIAIAAGLRGDFERAHSLIATAERALAPFQANGPWATVVVARARVTHAEGRHLDAFRLFQSLFDPSDHAYFPRFGARGLVDLAEAAVYSGKESEARAIVESMRTRASRIKSPTLGMLVDQAEAILATDSEADDLLQAALADERSSPYSHARIALAYGAWLRRQQRVVEARTQLREARAVFDAVAAHPWSQRANQELRAAGETTRRRAQDAREELTAQEHQIVELAAQGLTNREIGERLFLSHRTVGSHLYRAFPKLGISSRSELRARQPRG